MILGMTQDTGIHGILRKDKRIDQMSNYNLIKETDTLKKCFKTLKGSFNGLICVISKTKKLLGTVSDGDLRRSMLKGMPLNSKVNEVMNKKPLLIFRWNRSKDFVAFDDDLKVDFYIEVNSFGCHFKVTKLEDWIKEAKKVIT